MTNTDGTNHEEAPYDTSVVMMVVVTLDVVILYVVAPIVILKSRRYRRTS
jgi:hypothetical protein